MSTKKWYQKGKNGGNPPPKTALMVGRAGFEPAKSETIDLQSIPFDRFGTDPQKASGL